jgi:hypothetical protein
MAEQAHTGRFQSGIEHPGSCPDEPARTAVDAGSEQDRLTSAALLEAYGQGQRDFRNVDLMGADWAGAGLADAVFDGSKLKDANVAQANPANASFIGAVGPRAYASGCIGQAPEADSRRSGGGVAWRISSLRT